MYPTKGFPFWLVKKMEERMPLARFFFFVGLVLTTITGLGLMVALIYVVRPAMWALPTLHLGVAMMVVGIGFEFFHKK